MNLSLFMQGNVANQFNDFLLLGYAVMGIIGLVYIVSLAVRQRNVQQDIRLMKQLLQEDEEPEK